jgi:DNA repair photolyase
MSVDTKGRGALSNPPSRFDRVHCEREIDPAQESVRAELTADHSRTVLTRNRSPDLPFSQSVNPYRGCEHGCIYCYARPSHAYLGLSSGRDFETRVLYKPEAARLLLAELARPGYQVNPIALGTNTDPYQPAERELGITRSLLAALLAVRHPMTIVTKGSLIERDLDLLSELAALDLVAVDVSVTTLDLELKRRMEPRAAGPERRLKTISRLIEHGVPTGVLLAPIIPGLNEHELERMLEAAARAGAQRAAYVLIRLPHDVKALFTEWLEEHYPDRAAHVMSLIRQSRNGELDDSRFHSRQRGSGPLAALLAARFDRACRRWHLNMSARPRLATHLFRSRSAQLTLQL